HWVDRLERNAEQAKKLIGEQRYRIWRIYMAGSAHAFDRGWISIFQILAFKPTSTGEVAYPLTRAHIYD
ncbi:MAG: class I SAM-dependent methyltransferase, partial [Betaproteobacteria bacterium]